MFVPQKSSFLTLFLKFWPAAFCSEQVSLPRNGSERNSDRLFLYLLHGTEFRVVFSSAEGFGREFREIAFFVSTERNSELFSLPLKCSEGNSESLLLFLLNGTEFRVVFSSAEGFGTEFRGFLFRGTAGIPSEITICSVYSVFRGIIFLSEIPNPNHTSRQNIIIMFWKYLVDIRSGLANYFLGKHKWKIVCSVGDCSTDVLFTANEGQLESNINVWFPFTRMYSQKRNCYFQNRIILLCLLVPTLIYLREIYTYPG